MKSSLQLSATILAIGIFSRFDCVDSWMMMNSAGVSKKKVVVIGGGIQGTSVAYHVKKEDPDCEVTILESNEVASAASGKGGGFMARSWGNGSVTQQLHHVAFDMYEEMAGELKCESYRKLPVLSVRPGNSRSKTSSQYQPSWLDGNTGGMSVLGDGYDTAQVTPYEFVHAMLKAQPSIQVLHGTCNGVITTESDDTNSDLKVIKRITYETPDREQKELDADAVVVSAGPWSCAAEDWFDGVVQLPMEGVKSTSIVWRKPSSLKEVDATALFCGEDHRFGTHLEVYPRPDGTIYICGIGGSDYITKEELKNGDFREKNTCNAKEARVKAASDAFRTMSNYYKENGELEKTQACMRPCPPDALPYMGKIPGYQGAYINAGHNCWGIAWAPACGKAMSELIVNGESTTIDLQPFSPSRFTKPKGRGGRGRKRFGASVGEQW